MERGGTDEKAAICNNEYGNRPPSWVYSMAADWSILDYCIRFITGY
ncbi:MAG: hypothetical protein LBB22_01960 [Treponema sp.]|nr:hypothetical protein [Treponema sp.]